MAHNIQVIFLFLISKLPLLTRGSIDPFMDQTMFMIDWKGPLLEPLEGKAADQMVVMTKDQEQYQCILPEVFSGKNQDAIDSYEGPSATALMEKLFQQTSCSYRLESYWTYELCHGKHLRQYHEVKEQGKKSRLQEYFLGFGHFNPDAPEGAAEASGTSTTEEQKPPRETNIKFRNVDGVNLPYYEVLMRDGTPCDLTQKPRQTRVLYVCQPDGHGEVYEFKETSTCEYEVMVLTSALCSHPLFRPKNPPVNKISCHSLSGAPLKPQTLDTWEQESKKLITDAEDMFFTGQDLDDSIPEPTPPPQKKVPKILTSKSPQAPPPDTTINKLTDQQVLKELMSGDYCLQGGVGWWKHEVCIGRYVRQFHREKSGETSIILGHFHEKAHLEWLQQNPNKQPKKDLEKRKYLNYLYTGGDVCDAIGQHRKVEVRFKCISNSNNPHGVSLFLSEPAVCEYVLVIESAMICQLMDKVDDNALLMKEDL